MTTTYAALLRGINIGGRRKVPMAELRTVLTGLGLEDVRTLLQSGNAVFTGPDTGVDELTRTVQRAVSERFGFDVPCMLRSGAELRSVADRSPYDPDAYDPAKLTVTFLSGPIDPERLDGVDPARYAPDEYRLAEREIYAHFPDGLGRSKLTPLFDAARLGVEATTRNWNTLTKLIALTGE